MTWLYALQIVDFSLLATGALRKYRHKYSLAVSRKATKVGRPAAVAVGRQLPAVATMCCQYAGVLECDVSTRTTAQLAQLALLQQYYCVSIPTGSLAFGSAACATKAIECTAVSCVISRALAHLHSRRGKRSFRCTAQPYGRCHPAFTGIILRTVAGHWSYVVFSHCVVGWVTAALWLPVKSH